MKPTKKEIRIITEFHDLISSNDLSDKLRVEMSNNLKETYEEVKGLIKQLKQK